MIAPLLLILVTLAAVFAVACASGPAASPGSSYRGRTAGPTGPSVDWHALYVGELQRSRRRLAGWNRANHRVLRLQRGMRNLLHRRGTGVPFLDEALCIHGFESRDWRNRGHHFGGMQFNLGTWHGVGGYGNPADADPVEQIYRAFLVWRRDGYSWREWSTAPLCGLR
jgi:hypothetical protein